MNTEIKKRRDIPPFLVLVNQSVTKVENPPLHQQDQIR